MPLSAISHCLHRLTRKEMRKGMRKGALLVVAALSLAGCASGPMRVNTDVQAFRTPAATDATPIHWQQGARYRFDVLPSQAGLNVTPLHAMTQAALAQHGLVRDEAQARFAVQVSASVRSAWVNDGWGPYGAGLYGSGLGWYMGFGHLGWGSAHLPAHTYLRELRIALQDLRSGQTVYETRARNESPGDQNDPIFNAMVRAALKDFPHATTGWQRVVTELPASPAPMPAPMPSGKAASPAQ